MAGRDVAVVVGEGGSDVFVAVGWIGVAVGGDDSVILAMKASAIPPLPD